jgi:hypothetical protein
VKVQFSDEGGPSTGIRNTIIAWKATKKKTRPATMLDATQKINEIQLGVQ